MDTTETVATAIELTGRAPPDRAARRARSRGAAVAAALILGDALAALVTGGALALASASHPGPATLLAGPLSLPVFCVLPIFAALGLYAVYGPSPPERLRLRALGVAIYATACLLATGAAPAAPLLGQASLLGQAPLLGQIAAASLLLVLIGFYGEAAVRAVLIRRAAWGAPTVIVGADAHAHALARTLLAQPELGLRPIGYLTDPARPAEAAAAIHAHPDLPHLGRLDGAAGIGGAEVAIFASCADLAQYDSRLGRLPFGRVVLAQQIQDLQNMWMQVRPLGDAIGLEIRRELYRPRNLLMKRLLDGLLAGIGLLLLLPLIGVLALAIRRIDPGSPFYAQTRVGRHGRPIRVWKLRTMYRDAETRIAAHLAADPAAAAEWARYFKLRDDPRVLPGLGRFLRRTSLDELPQLWNVLRGDMSLVGPRPFPAYHMDGFEPDFRALRTSVPPGLTGLWQISARSDGDLAVQRSQDGYYIRNWSLWLDLYILLATIPAVLCARGAR
ncbi:hypothetical protein GCM10007886_05930 [Methylobacterium gregans]|uniref:Bacterial sugar transferase domain-containing protein n=1 Tax=Methylobacterium gregans TaxID=374424 RepID=A0AA37M968_9HYPH|nr:exopolysaccharide biosynthesis polyprenyl glycosylphosphotransferase [Methylobacterium gregans]MDQ0520014.1 Undecaprenyl-phosphate galactose phosphotransferase WbaP [Methylobacterium gregans]GJD77041.1 hypothetical protein NBEOAGPD_0243 [Methylobacterium gregans]GLS52410.1 hypothetical protein GCM10007886_05930 [Methylobacterium gregans]